MSEECDKIGRAVEHGEAGGSDPPPAEPHAEELLGASLLQRALLQHRGRHGRPAALHDVHQQTGHCDGERRSGGEFKTLGCCSFESTSLIWPVALLNR